ncbi:MAG: coenzyme F420-0:L-glutamate ligase [Proteobacteria bacterium]|nr:coenzyme F420-0:L-glutamate ligase [Pseudomonadota bacterium]
MPPATLALVAPPDVPLVRPGDDLGAIVIAAVERADIALDDRNVVVVAQKIVSKAEGRYVDLARVSPSPRARELAGEVDKDPRLVEVILSESSEILRYRMGVLVVAHRLGVVMANAGVDRSNVEPVDGSERILLLPENPDATCAALKARLDAHFGLRLAVIVSDSVGRAWRKGAVGIALGAAGLPALDDRVGRRDLYGRALEVTQVGLADEIASAAALLMGEADEGQPIVIVGGLDWDAPDAAAAALLRPAECDLFR